MSIIVYTLVFELRASTGWTGYIRQLPEVVKVRGSHLDEVKYQLADQLVDLLWAMPDTIDILVTSEFNYALPTSPEQLTYN